VPRVVAAVGHLIAPPQDPGDVDLSCHCFGSPGREPSRRERLDRTEKRLGRKAGVVGALAAGELVLDDDDLDVGVEPAERSHEMLAARARAEHDHTTSTHGDTLLLEMEWGQTRGV